MTCLLAEKGVQAGARLIVITADANSPLAHAATLAVPLATPHNDVSAMGTEWSQYKSPLFEQSAFLLCESVVLQAIRAWDANSAALWARHANLE